MRQPPDWLNIKFDPQGDIQLEYSEYVDRLKDRLDSISATLLGLHNENQLREKQKHSDTLRNTPVYKEGQLVYFLMPASGALNTNTKKFVVRYVGPVKIKSVIDKSHVILEDMEDRLIAGVHHTNRVKPAHVRGKDGIISSASELTKALQSGGDSLVDVPGSSNAAVAYLSDYFSFEESTEHTAHVASTAQSDNMKTSQSSAVSIQFPEEELVLTKSRFKNGELQVLFSNHSKSFLEWYDLSLYPQLNKECAGNLSRTSGSLRKLDRILQGLTRKPHSSLW
jgi:hypothetical protein